MSRLFKHSSHRSVKSVQECSRLLVSRISLPHWVSDISTEPRARRTLHLLALAMMIYALITFHWRAAAIRKRSTAPYDDRFGPVRRLSLHPAVCRPVLMYVSQTILCIALMGKHFSPYVRYLDFDRSISCGHCQLCSSIYARLEGFFLVLLTTYTRIGLGTSFSHTPPCIRMNHRRLDFRTYL